MKIGYARVSTDEQNLGLQLDALQADGCGRVFEDTASGAKSSRKGLADALQACTSGDGRPHKLAPDQLDMAAQLIAGDRSQREVAKVLGVAVSTLREALKQRAA
jgi:hypothetical protein